MLAFLCAAILLPQSPVEPEWIWSGATSVADDTCYFRGEFELDQSVKSARLVASCDNHFVAWLNGEQVASSDNWESPEAVDVQVAFARGRNVLAFKGWNDDGPAGLIAWLDLQLESGAQRRIGTDAGWRVASEPMEGWRTPAFDQRAWQAVHSFGPSSDHRGPWGDIMVRRRATPAESLVVPAGFEVDLLRSAQLGEGSWVCLTFDDRGRLIVSPQSGRLLRVTLPGIDGDTAIEALDVPVGGAQGLLHAHGSLFVNVNARPEDNGGLWRLRDTDGDDQYDDVTRLSSWGPGGEHGPHAVIEGPDGKLWVVNGNMTSRPEVVPSSPHRNYEEDLLLPRATDPRGHAVQVRAPGSSVYRFDLEGGGWELMAAGMRNAYDLAFGPDGELFSFDSDMEWDIGLPWYRPTRIVHIVSGGEYGWRTGSGKWPTWYHDSLPAVVDIGVSSPTGMAFGTKSAFPEPYRSALFVGDWAYGRILAVHLEPDGASYRGSFEEFVKGLPLNVTDFDFGPDGALYFVTGGRGTQSGLYRIRALRVGPRATRLPVVAAAEPTSRALRRQLEAWHCAPAAGAVLAAWPHLDHRDRFVRYAARLAIERQDVAEWRESALAESRVDAALEALLALARVGDAGDRVAILARLGGLGPKGLGRDQALRWLRVHDVCLARMERPEPGLAESLRARLEPLFPADSYPQNRDLTRLLIYLESPVVVVRAMRLLRAARSESEQLRFAFDLRNASIGWTPELREDFFTWVLRARGFEGGHSFGGYLDVIQKDALQSMSEEERSHWMARLAPEEKSEAPREVEGPVFRNWQMADLVGDLGAVDRGRSFAGGKAVFERALCATCHRIGSAGGSIGPDLTGAAGRFSRRDLLEAILLPSEVISDQYQAVVVTAKTGDQIVGRIVEEDDDKVALLLGVFGDDRTEVKKSNIESIEASPVSTMPAGLVNGMQREQILDLLAYLVAAGDPNHSAFKN